jgi:hypothetical protein
MKKKFVLLIILLLVVNFLLFLPCDKDLYCHGVLSKIVQYPFVWLVFITPLSLLALTLTDQKHKFWLKLTGIFFAIAMFFVSLMPETARGIMLNPDKESTNWFFLGIYTITSIIYFIVQFFRKRKLFALVK